MMGEQRNSRQKYTKGERLAFHWQPPEVPQTKAKPIHRQTQSDSIAPGHRAENALPNGIWPRVSVSASCFRGAAVDNVFLPAATESQLSRIRKGCEDLPTRRGGPSNTEAYRLLSHCFIGKDNVNSVICAGIFVVRSKRRDSGHIVALSEVSVQNAEMHSRITSLHSSRSTLTRCVPRASVDTTHRAA